MFKNKFSTFLEIIHNMLWISTIGYLLECMFYLENKTMTLIEMWPVFLLTGLSFTLYYFADKFWIYLIGEIISAVLFIVVGRGHLTGYVIALLFCIGFQIAEKKQQYILVMHPTWAFCGAYGVMYFLALFTGRTGPVKVIPYIMMLFLITALLYLNTMGMDGFLSVRKNVKNIQVGLIKRNNSLFISAVMGLVFMLFLFAGFFMDDSPILWLIEQMKQYLVKLLKYAKNLFEYKGERVQPAEKWEYFSNAEEYTDDEFMIRKTTADIPEFVYYILGTIITIIVLVFVVKALNSLIKLLIKRFAKKEEIEELEFVIADEVISIDPKNKKTVKEMKAKTPSERVRKMYRRTILRNRRKQGMGEPERCLTPEELEAESFGNNRIDGQEQLHSLYEKARYSEAGVSETEELGLKNILT